LKYVAVYCVQLYMKDSVECGIIIFKLLGMCRINIGKDKLKYSADDIL